MEQLKTLGTQHEDIKLQIQEANEVHNFGRVTQLQNELEVISTQQMQLINEQSELSRVIKRYDRYAHSLHARVHSPSHVRGIESPDFVSTGFIPGLRWLQK